MFYPGIDDLVFAGFAQAVPTLFPFVECQARVIGAYATGNYRPPSVPEMRETIKADTEFFTGHMVKSARHTQQLDHYLYEHNIRTKELPEGRRRAQELGPVRWAGVADAVSAGVTAGSEASA